MMRKILPAILAGLILAALGILAGRASVGGSAASAHEAEHDHAAETGHDHEAADDHDHEAGAEHDHDADHDHDHAAEEHDHPHVSTEALRNMGVEVKALETVTYTERRELLGRIVATTINTRSLSAPIGGQVTEILVEPGMVVAAGQPILRYVRDPIPRPLLTLTGEILTPARESVHQNVAELRRTKEEVSIYQEELDRVTKFTDGGKGELPVLPRQTAIDLRYQLLRARRALDQSRLELNKHGFTDEQIEAMAGGASIPDLGEETWHRALTNNGLWTDRAAHLFAALPKKLHGDRWTVATVAEVAAGGLVDDELIAFLAEAPEAAEHFIEIGSLLQQGMSVPELTLLHARGGLEPVVTLLAPPLGEGTDWDIAEILVRVGARIDKGTSLVALSDPRVLQLRIDPVGGEQAAALAAVGRENACVARPLVPEAGPSIAALTLSHATGDAEGQGTVIWARLQNEVERETVTTEGRRFRSWKLRVGLRYLVGVPLRTIPEVWVLPIAAFTTRGADTIVFVADGDSFRPEPVVVVQRDDRFAIVPAHDGGGLSADDRVVVAGAYALGLALFSGQQAPDAHAGHNH